MAKLVVLSAGLNGQTYELKVDRTTVGRVEDNTFQIAQPSVSSYHCEILLRGNDVVVKDLNSTNGTFVNNEPITTEGVIKPGQILRLGQIEMRLDAGDGSTPSPEAMAASPASSKPRQNPTGSTMVITRGVDMDKLGRDPSSLDTAKGEFTKKTNKGNMIFIVIGIVLFLVILVAVWMVLVNLSNKTGGH